MSSGYRRYQNKNSHRRDENLTHKPTIDQHAQTHETSSSSSTPHEPSSSSHQSNQNHPQFRKSSRRAPRNRGKKIDSNFTKESEKEEEDSNSGLKIDSNFNGNDDCSVGGSGSGLNLGSNNSEIEGHRGDSEKGKAISEGLNSDDEVDEGETLKRLKELKLSVEEPELSEEFLAINQQLQEDELLVMESIYGDNIIILDDQSGLKCFQVNIHIEVPDRFRISTKFNSSNFHEKSYANDVSDFSYSLQVEYLPPIVLTCLLPISYPSKSPPYFTIFVKWLGSTKISDLCRKLDSIWLEQAGQEVIYQWVDWLQNSTLSYLGFDSEIVLGPCGVRHDEDTRAISGCVSPDIDIPSMKSYNDEKHYEHFCRNIQECGICLSEFAGSKFTRLPCQHFFCGTCLKTFIDIHVMEGTVFKIKCPESKCDGTVPPSLLKRFLREEEFKRWDALVLEKTLESMTDVVKCPRCETACLEDKDDHAQCSKCDYSFCTLCRNRRHVGVACMDPEMKLRILQERQNSTSLNSEQRRREQDLINDILSVKEIKSFAKQCPSCNMAIARTEGCNKMVCNNCGHYFCYRCNKEIEGYDHFRDGNCELFPQEEIQRWNERMNGLHVGQIHGQIFANHGHPCPLCGQLNVKMGNNNHILCWACANHYCYLCKKMVRRSSEHYVPKGCKQHSAG